jgi:hypothetical protein
MKHELLKILNVTEVAYEHHGYVLKLKIREGVSEAVIQRFATVQHTRWQLLTAFSGHIYMQDMAKLMACSSINWKVHEGHLYISFLIDEEALAFTNDIEPDTFGQFRMIMNSMPKG